MKIAARTNEKNIESTFLATWVPWTERAEIHEYFWYKTSLIKLLVLVVGGHWILKICSLFLDCIKYFPLEGGNYTGLLNGRGFFTQALSKRRVRPSLHCASIFYRYFFNLLQFVYCESLRVNKL